MKSLRDAFAAVAARGAKAFVPFLPLGFPSLEATGELMAALDEAGADAIELGMPFSDSLADGPVIQYAYHQALRTGLTVGAALDFLARQRPLRRPPFVLMCCYNLVHRMGVGAFADRIRQSGVNGVIAPDLPFDESSELRLELERLGIGLVNLVAPTTPPARLKRIARLSRGFVYYVSRKGVTGVTGELAGDVIEMVTKIKESARVPVLVGFGISTPERARTVVGAADGVIVGSALVELIRRDAAGGVAAVRELARSFRAVLGAGGGA